MDETIIVRDGAFYIKFDESLNEIARNNNFFDLIQAYFRADDEGRKVIVSYVLGYAAGKKYREERGHQMTSSYKFSEWTYVDKTIAENHHICTRCHSDITSDHIGKPVLITYDGDNVEYICPDCTADFFFYSLGKTLEALNCDPVDTEQEEEDRKERMQSAERRV